MSLEHNQELMQAAISYAQLGWRVFPLQPLTKIPLFRGSWPEYATNDIDILKAWWSVYPNANIALVTDTFTVVDVDRKPGKVDGLLQVGEDVDHSTPWVATPNGGYHFYYRNTDVPLRSIPGVDTLTGNHYVLAPPSRLPGEAPWDADRAYVWGNPVGPVWDDGLKHLSLDLLLKLLRREDPRSDHEAHDFPGLLERLPSIPRAELKEAHQIFLQSGMVVGYPSRSEVVMSLATRLYQLGYTDIEVVSMLWNEDWVQTTANEHRRTEDRALEDWLWGTAKKVRHHRQKRADEVFSPIETSRQEDTFRTLRDECLRTDATGDLKDLLRRIAVARLMAIDEDDLLNILVTNAGRKKGALTRTLNDLKRDLAKPEDPHGGPRWRHITAGDHPKPLPTVQNLEALLEHKGATVWHNLMTHRIEVASPEAQAWNGEEALNNQLTAVRSWAAEYQLPMDPIGEQLVLLAQRREYHPFQHWVESQAWDGRARLPTLLETIRVPVGKEHLRDTLVKRWLVSVCAAVWGYQNRAPRGVLTFTGAQQIGKTTWLKYLVPKGMYRQGLILRTDQKDSATSGLRALIAEIGEIGTTFRRQDIESLKNYIGQHEDRYRLPYARDESIWQRRTIFAASANDKNILHDQSGNTRWWVLPVEGFDLDHMERWWGNGAGRELQQLWAEVLALYNRGEAWDLSDKELIDLGSHQEEHMEETPIESALRDVYAWEEVRPYGGYHIPKREMDVARDLGFGSRPLTVNEGRQLRDALRRLTGQDCAHRRRVSLATVDGQPVASEGQNKKVLGRWWFVPPLMNSTEGPFNA